MYNFSVTEEGRGEIQIDNFREQFSVDFGFWTKGLAIKYITGHYKAELSQLREARGC